MWEEEYCKLSNYEKNEFREIGNHLLSRTYMVKERFDSTKKMTIQDEKYRMASRLFSVMRDYFEIIGWKLEIDNEYDVISIRSIYDNNRLRFGRFTTLFLYTLRLIYEEEREKVNSYRNVRTETHLVVEKMAALGLLQKGKTTITERIDAQRALEHHNIIQKTEGKWESDGNHLIILPSILHIITNQGINDMIAELEDMKVILSVDDDKDDNSEEE